LESPSTSILLVTTEPTRAERLSRSTSVCGHGPAGRLRGASQALRPRFNSSTSSQVPRCRVGGGRGPSCLPSVPPSARSWATAIRRRVAARLCRRRVRPQHRVRRRALLRWPSLGVHRACHLGIGGEPRVERASGPDCGRSWVRGRRAIVSRGTPRDRSSGGGTRPRCSALRRRRGGGKLLGPTAEETTNAPAIAGSDASGTEDYDRTGREVKRFHAAVAVRSGMKAALLGRLGVTGPRPSSRAGAA
jgi:hypothetical protein